MRWRNARGNGSVLSGEHFAYPAGRTAVPPDVDEATDDCPHLLMAERRRLEPHVHASRCHTCHRQHVDAPCCVATVGSTERRKVVLSHQCPGRCPHGSNIERFVDAPPVVANDGINRSRVINQAIAVGPRGRRKARVKLSGYRANLPDRDGIANQRIEPQAGFGLNVGVAGQVNVDDLCQGVDSAVSSAGARHRNVGAIQTRPRALKGALHGDLVLLSSEPCEGSAVIGKIDAEPHARPPGGGVGRRAESDLGVVRVVRVVVFFFSSRGTGNGGGDLLVIVDIDLGRVEHRSARSLGDATATTEQATGT